MKLRSVTRHFGQLAQCFTPARTASTAAGVRHPPNPPAQEAPQARPSRAPAVPEGTAGASAPMAPRVALKKQPHYVVPKFCLPFLNGSSSRSRGDRPAAEPVPPAPLVPPGLAAGPAGVSAREAHPAGQSEITVDPSSSAGPSAHAAPGAYPLAVRTQRPDGRAATSAQITIASPPDPATVPAGEPPASALAVPRARPRKQPHYLVPKFCLPFLNGSSSRSRSGRPAAEPEPAGPVVPPAQGVTEPPRSADAAGTAVPEASTGRSATRTGRATLAQLLHERRLIDTPVNVWQVLDDQARREGVVPRSDLNLRPVNLWEVLDEQARREGLTPRSDVHLERRVQDEQAAPGGSARPVLPPGAAIADERRIAEPPLAATAAGAAPAAPQAQGQEAHVSPDDRARPVDCAPTVAHPLSVRTRRSSRSSSSVGSNWSSSSVSPVESPRHAGTPGQTPKAAQGGLPPGSIPARRSLTQARAPARKGELPWISSKRAALPEPPVQPQPAGSQASAAAVPPEHQARPAQARPPEQAPVLPQPLSADRRNDRGLAAQADRPQQDPVDDVPQAHHDVPVIGIDPPGPAARHGHRSLRPVWPPERPQDWQLEGPFDDLPLGHHDVPVIDIDLPGPASHPGRRSSRPIWPPERPQDWQLEGPFNDIPLRDAGSAAVPAERPDRLPQFQALVPPPSTGDRSAARPEAQATPVADPGPARRRRAASWPSLPAVDRVESPRPSGMPLQVAQAAERRPQQPSVPAGHAPALAAPPTRTVEPPGVSSRPAALAQPPVQTPLPGLLAASAPNVPPAGQAPPAAARASEPAPALPRPLPADRLDLRRPPEPAADARLPGPAADVQPPRSEHHIIDIETPDPLPEHGPASVRPGEAAVPGVGRPHEAAAAGPQAASAPPPDSRPAHPQEPAADRGWRATLSSMLTPVSAAAAGVVGGATAAVSHAAGSAVNRMAGASRAVGSEIKAHGKSLGLMLPPGRLLGALAGHLIHQSAAVGVPTFLREMLAEGVVLAARHLPPHQLATLQAGVGLATVGTHLLRRSLENRYPEHAARGFHALSEERWNALSDADKARLRREQQMHSRMVTNVQAAASLTNSLLALAAVHSGDPTQAELPARILATDLKAAMYATLRDMTQATFSMVGAEGPTMGVSGSYLMSSASFFSFLGMVTNYGYSYLPGQVPDAALASQVLRGTAPDGTLMTRREAWMARAAVAAVKAAINTTLHTGDWFYMAEEEANEAGTVQKWAPVSHVLNPDKRDYARVLDHVPTRIALLAGGNTAGHLLGYTMRGNAEWQSTFVSNVVDAIFYGVIYKTIVGSWQAQAEVRAVARGVARAAARARAAERAAARARAEPDSVLSSSNPADAGLGAGRTDPATPLPGWLSPARESALSRTPSVRVDGGPPTEMR